MRDMFRRYGGTLTGSFILLTAFWLLALVVLPNITLFEFIVPVLSAGHRDRRHE